MAKKLKIEIFYFTVILLVLAFMQHSDLLTSPVQRVELMAEKGNFLHPLLWAFSVYVVVGIIRLIISYILNLKNRIKNR